MKLDGVRVLDLSRFLPGPLCTQMMSDHGAEVIKVEAVQGGEPTREVGGKRDGVSVFFANTNRGKKSLALNLKTSEGVEAVMRLAATCDVVVESFRPGVAERLGIGYESVCARAPQIVYASISSFGRTGPKRDLASHDLTIEAAAGVLSITRGRDGAPAIPGLASADITAALASLSGILMALLRRHATGRGDFLDMAMSDCLLAGLTNNMDTAMAKRQPPDLASGRSLGGNALYSIYETSDREWIAIGSQEPKFAANILNALGRPDLIPLSEEPPGSAQLPLRDFLTHVLRTRTARDWAEFFDDLDVPISPVRSLPEVLDDPQYRDRGMVLTDARGWDHLGTPIKFAAEPGVPVLEAPALGQHSTEILATAGYSADEIGAAISNGVVRQANEHEIAMFSGSRGLSDA
jgi:crotonobetainyl-CoA:carnitine CoA-transferase CaiB-like acyl-CoA transferase